MEDNAKIKAKTDLEIHEIKVKSEKEICNVTIAAKHAVKKAEDTSFTRSIKARETLCATCVAASQKVASSVSQEILKRKTSQVEAAELTENLCQESVLVAAATNMANAAVICKEEAKLDAIQSTERRLKDQYRSTIEELQDQLKTSRASSETVTIELQRKDNKLDELTGAIKVRLHSLPFVS